MKEKARLTKVKGTVLFTVVSVMMVLIVFLMGTLALAATANNRANRNYQKEQTEATARAVLDAVVEAINQDDKKVGGLTDKIGNLSIGGADLTFNVTFDEGGTKKEYPVTITKMEERPFYEKDKWQTGNVYSVSTTIIMQSTGVETVYTAYMSDAEINTGNGGKGGGNGGAFVSVGGSNKKIGTGGFVSGGTEIGIGKKDGIGMVEFENSTSEMAPAYINGDLKMKSQVNVYFNQVAEKQYFAVTGDLWFNNNFEGVKVAEDFDFPDKVDYNQIPCIYVGKTLHLQAINDDNKTPGNATDVCISDGSKTPVNIYCGSIKAPTDKSSKFSNYGDIYCFDAFETSYLYYQAKSTSKLYQWTKKTIVGKDGNEENHLFGSFYSKGSLETDMDTEGDIRVENNLTIVRNSNVGGDVVVGNILKIASGATLTCNNIYADTIENNGTIQCNGKIYTRSPGVSANELAGSTRVWYTDYTHTPPVYVKTEDWGDARYEYSCSYVKHSQNLDLDGNEVGEESKETITYTTQYNLVQMSGDIRDATDEQIREALGIGATLTATSFETGESFPRYEAMNSDKYVIISSVTSEYGDIYPDEYEKDNIINNIVPPPDASEYSYTDDLTDADSSITATVSEAPIALDEVSETNPITDSGLLSGTCSKDLYIDATGGAVFLIVDDFSMSAGSSIYIEDGKGVYFFVRGNFTMNNNCNIITNDYNNYFKDGNDPGTNLPVSEIDVGGTIKKALIIDQVQENSDSPYYPNVFMYAQKYEGIDDSARPKFTCANGLFTVNFNAPSLVFNQTGNGGYNCPTAIEYRQWSDDGITPTIKEYGSGTPISVIGQLVCWEINPQNNFNLIYVTLPESNTCGCCASCTGASGCPCSCAKCKCNAGSISGGSSSAAPDKLYTMYYNYY